MTDEELLLKACRLYDDICYFTNNEKGRGMQISAIRKKYGLEKRDLQTLFRFLDKYDEVYGDTSVESFNYFVYKVSKEQEELDKIELLDYVDVEEDEGEWSTEHFDDTCFVRIEDSISVLCKKISENNIDITNVALLDKITNDEEFRKSWSQVSDVSLEEAYIIDKGNNDKKQMEDIKKAWIRACVKCNCLKINNSAKEMLPLGLYYDCVTQKYKCVYWQENKKQKILLETIAQIDSLEENTLSLDKNSLKEIKQTFNIYDYIKSVQVEEMELKVYDEGKVIYKLKELFKDNQCVVEEYDDYAIFRIKTDEPEEYLKVLNGYGRSVIVLKPENQKKEVIEMINNTLEKYEMLKKM